MPSVRLDDFVNNALDNEMYNPDTSRLDDAVMSQRIPVNTDEINLLELITIPDSLKSEWETSGKIGFFEHARGVKSGKFVPFVGTGIEAKKNLDVFDGYASITSE